MDGGEDFFFVDSKSVEVHRVARGKRCKMGPQSLLISVSVHRRIHCPMLFIRGAPCVPAFTAPLALPRSRSREGKIPSPPSCRTTSVLPCIRIPDPDAARAAAHRSGSAIGDSRQKENCRDSRQQRSCAACLPESGNARSGGCAQRGRHRRLPAQKGAPSVFAATLARPGIQGRREHRQ